MTVIAWDGKNLAADSLITWTGTTKMLSFPKIEEWWVEGTRHIVGGVGNAFLIDKVLDKFVDGDFKEDPEYHLLHRNGTDKDEECTSADIIHFTDTSNYLHLTVWTNLGGLRIDPRQRLAWGSGCEVALGAMHAGKSARRAVEITCQVDLFCGGPVKEIKIVR